MLVIFCFVGLGDGPCVLTMALQELYPQPSASTPITLFWSHSVSFHQCNSAAVGMEPRHTRARLSPYTKSMTGGF